MLDVMNADQQSELVTKLVQAWESKNAKRVARGAVLSTMALSLAACGGSSDPVAEDDAAADDAAADDAAADEEVTVATMSALQSQAAELITSIAASDAAVEAATLAAGSSAAVLDINDLAAAPLTAAAATAAFNAYAANLVGQLTTSPVAPNGVAGNTGLESSAALGEYAGLATTLAGIMTANSAVTAAQKTALATADAAFATAFSVETAQDAADVLASSVAVFGATATRTAATEKAAGGLTSVGKFLGGNAFKASVDGDTVAATPAEQAAGLQAYADVIVAAIVANNTAFATAYAAMTPAVKAQVHAAAAAAVTAVATPAANGADPVVTAASNITIDANTGMVIGDTTFAGAAVAAVNPADDAAPSAASGTYASVAAAINNVANVTLTIADDVVGTIDVAFDVDAAIDGLEVQGYINNVADQAYDAALMAAYSAMIEAAKAVVAADDASVIAGIQANNVATLSLGVDNIDIDGGAATSGNDVFVFSEAGGNMTIGTAATASAPGNVLFGAGEDSVVIAGAYEFVTIATAAAQATLGTTAVGDSAVLEAFVYQDAVTGNAVISFEENAFDGSVKTGAAMTTLTLTDITFADLTVEVIDGYTVLSHDAAVA